MVFNRRSGSHNRTDVHDTNTENIYGDAGEGPRRRDFQSNEEQKIPNQSQNNNRRAPMPDNPFDNSFSSNFNFSNFGMRAPPSGHQQREHQTGPTRINLSRANFDPGQNNSEGKFLCKVG